MAVIPEALVKKEAGIEILNDRSREGTETLWILIAILSKSAVFTGTKGTLMDKYLAYIGNPETVNETCVAQYRATSTQVIQACENKFTFNPEKFSLDLGERSFDLFDIPTNMLFYGAVFANRMVGVIDDADRVAISRAYAGALSAIGEISKTGVEGLQKLGREGAVQKYGPVFREAFGENGQFDAEMFGDMFDMCSDAMKSLTAVNGNHPEVTAIAAKSGSISKFTEEDFDSSVYARMGDVSAAKARQKMRSEFRTDNKHVQFFVFSRDIGTAKDYLAEQGKPHSEFDAIGLLADAKRTGDRRFPRWGLVIPAKCILAGSKNIILGDAASSVDGKWESVYSDIARMSGDTVKEVFGEGKNGEMLRQQVMADLLRGGRAGELLDLSVGSENVTVRPPYMVTFTGKNAEAKMGAVMKLLGRVASGFRTPQKTVSVEEMATTGKEGNEMTDSAEAQMSEAMKNGAIESGDDLLREIINVPNENKVFDAAVRIFKEFPELQQSKVFQENKELFGKYRAGQHELHSTGNDKDLPLDEDEIATLAAETIHAMVDSRGVYVTRFFDPSKFRLGERLGIPYIADWGLTERGEQLMDAYVQKVEDRKGALAGGKFETARVRNMFPYMLLGRQFGATDNKWVSGAIRDLVAFESDLTDYLTTRPDNSDENNGKTLSEFKTAVMDGIQGTPDEKAVALSGEIKKLGAKISLGNLGALLSDADPKTIAVDGYDDLVCALFVNKHRDQVEREKFYRDHLTGGKESSGILDVLGIDQLPDLGTKMTESDPELLGDLAQIAADMYSSLDEEADATKRARRRASADGIMFELFDMAVVNGTYKGMGAVLSAIDGDLLSDGVVPLSTILSSPEYARLFEVSVEYYNSEEPQTVSMGPIGVLIDNFLGKLYGFGDSVVAAIGEPLKTGNLEGLGDVLKHIYAVDRDNVSKAIIAIPGLRPTPKPLPDGRLNTEVRNIDRAGAAAGNIRNAHDDKWLASVMPNDNDENEESLLKQIRRMKAERKLALQKKNGEAAPAPAPEAKPSAEKPTKPEETYDWSSTISDATAKKGAPAPKELDDDGAGRLNFGDDFADEFNDDEQTLDF